MRMVFGYNGAPIPELGLLVGLGYGAKGVNAFPGAVNWCPHQGTWQMLHVTQVVIFSGTGLRKSREPPSHRLNAGSFPRAFWSLPQLRSVEIQGTPAAY